MPVSYDWSQYQSDYWGFALTLAAIIVFGFIFVVFPIAALMYRTATREKHHIIYEGEYTLGSLLHPFRTVKSTAQFLQAFIASPLFWMLEIIGIVIFLFYLSFAADAFRSTEAFLAFTISGGIAFFTPFLWVALWWFADYKEREPLRIIVSLFLWGAFAALMAIGLNSILGGVLVIVGLGALGSTVFAPVFEEIFKGTGLVLFSLHHEFDGVNDGLVFGFTVGMGFAFVENWLYLIDNPLGANIGSWLFLFFMRSIMFSAMHGVYTSMTGGLIGFMKSRGYPQVPLSGFAMLPAMTFHAVHNSGELIMQLFGAGGTLAYCCFLMPLFDYGGFVLVALAMLAWLMVSKGKTIGVVV
ncbi:Protease prsW family protein [uncultured archaeon]|nr:Protease prsW family protein [uncultured archaeon]